MQGFEVTDIEIDLNELINYCKMRGIKNDGKARSQFVQKKIINAKTKNYISSKPRGNWKTFAIKRMGHVFRKTDNL